MNYRNVYNLILNLQEKGYSDGLTYEECVMVIKLLDVELSFLASNDSKWSKLYNEINIMCNQIYNSGILKIVSEKNYEYIIKNAFLLPLVLANNDGKHISLYSQNSYKFFCQFHSDSRASMGVSDIRNLLLCFSCQKGLNSVTYLKEYEGLTYRQSIELLTRIFLFDIDKDDYRFTNLVNKYQSSIVSDEYKYLLEKGYIRLKNRGIKNLYNVDVLKYYENVFCTIDRISDGNYDSNFEYDEPVKKIILKKN